MTEETSTSTGKKPSHIAWQVRDTGDGNGFWNRIGAAWTNRDGSLTIQLDAMPLDGRIICQVPKERDQ